MESEHSVPWPQSYSYFFKALIDFFFVANTTSSVVFAHSIRIRSDVLPTRSGGSSSHEPQVGRQRPMNFHCGSSFLGLHLVTDSSRITWQLGTSQAQSSLPPNCQKSTFLTFGSPHDSNRRWPQSYYRTYYSQFCAVMI